MSNSPAKLPDYLSLDTSSPWHIAALQVVGIESMTLTSRLKTMGRGRGTLQDLEESINSTGKRRVAKFGMSIADPDILMDKALEETTSAEKAGSMTSQNASETDNALATFDIDVFERDYRIARNAKKEHVFGRAESSRGNWSLADGSGRDPHDRFDSGPALQR